VVAMLCSRVSLSGMQAAKRLIILWVMWAASLSPQSAQPSTSQPDVFLVTIDTIRADHVHCYGYGPIQTPALDSLAKDGVLFAQAFTPSPITNASHTSILTGLLPSTHGVTDFAVRLASTFPVWADLLKKQGYHTPAPSLAPSFSTVRTLRPGWIAALISTTTFPKLRRINRDGGAWSVVAETWRNMRRPG